MTDEHEEDTPSPLVILGRTIGTFTGWDQGDTLAFDYYGFKPVEGLPIPACDLNVDYDNGYFSHYNDAGNKLGEWDIVTCLQAITR